MCRWLYQAQYRLKLNGRITEPYKWTTTCPLQGTGQRTGWSPPNWSSISDVITRAIDAHTPGICLVHPNQTNTHRTVDAFVDDTNSGLTTDGLHSFRPKPTTPVTKCDNIYDQTVANMQFYNDLLSSSGGKLALHKSYAYALTTKWNHGQRRLNETQRYLPPSPNLPTPKPTRHAPLITQDFTENAWYPHGTRWQQ